MSKPSFEKIVASAKLASELFPRKIIDENSETATEISQRVGCGKSAARAWVAEQCKVRKLEKVWKHIGTNLVPAYRIKR